MKQGRLRLKIVFLSKKGQGERQALENSLDESLLCKEQI